MQVTHPCNSDRHRLLIDRRSAAIEEQSARETYAIQRSDRAKKAAVKLLETYAFCPSLGLVVPIWADSLDAGMTMPNFRTMMLPHSDHEVGPRGGTNLISPVAIWSMSPKRQTVAGLRMRPDQPRPIYEENGQKWINIYRPPAFLNDRGGMQPKESLSWSICSRMFASGVGFCSGSHTSIVTPRHPALR